MNFYRFFGARKYSLARAQTYNSHSSRQSTSLFDLSLIDVWNFSLPNAIVTKQLFVPCLPFVKRPLAAKTVNQKWKRDAIDQQIEEKNM